MTTGPAVTAIPDAPPAQFLEDALHARSSGYRFATVIETGGEIATMVSGTVVGTSTQVVVSSSGVDIEYVSTPEGRWVRDGAADWVALDSVPSGALPLAGLEAAREVRYVAADGGVTVVEASYPGGVLGVEDLDEVVVEFEIVGGAVVHISWEAPLGSRSIRSTTELADLEDGVAITAPPATET